MKIVYGIAQTCNSGGMERVLANKANYLVQHGHEIMVVTTDQQGRAPYFGLDKRIVQVDLGVNYGKTRYKGLLQKIIAYPFMQLKHKQRLGKLLEDYQADIAISMFDHEASVLHKIKDGSKKVLEIHFSRYKRLQYGRKGLWRIVNKWRSSHDLRIARQYDRFVVLTQEDREYWGSLNNIEVIPNAHSFEPDIVASLNNKRVIAVGRYDHQKAFEELLYIWKQVKEVYPDWCLFIWGTGPLKEALSGLRRELGLESVVQLQPPVKEIEREYLQSSILAMTSRYEGLPMALLEGQACGLPLIAYACKCGPRDIIHHAENGYLIEEGDRKDFAKKLMLLMNNETLRKRMGRAAKEYAAGFSEKNIMEKWFALFEEVMREHRK